ncbi:unnamed protein product [Fusarium venenatum]|uniref:Uncharacterized protein n=1 Tax=Fusarium venenatum TaxID=56646 RepID=A0A2L2TBM6_9HYPO|nr:uncharacterized protein FVRRES_03831 [Fusarium venenatum]CEI67319.1 unnamed protein product [Fusarium venenatum]
MTPKHLGIITVLRFADNRKLHAGAVHDAAAVLIDNVSKGEQGRQRNWSGQAALAWWIKGSDNNKYEDQRFDSRQLRQNTEGRGLQQAPEGQVKLQPPNPTPQRQ